jgi:hypothetical protein
MVTNQVVLYLFGLLPYLMEAELAGIILAGFLGYLFMFECVYLCVVKSTVRLGFCNPYLWL